MWTRRELSLGLDIHYTLPNETVPRQHGVMECTLGTGSGKLGSDPSWQPQKSQLDSEPLN